MLKFITSGFYYLLLFSFIVLISEKFSLIESVPVEKYVLYQPNIGMNDAQFKNVIKYFGFKKKNKYVKKFDHNYKNISRLNDDKVIALLVSSCDVPINDLGDNLSNYVHLRRNKKYGYSIVEFKSPIHIVSQCILFKFNELVRNEYQGYLRSEKVLLTNLTSEIPQKQYKDFLYKKISLVDTLMTLQPKEFLRYHFWLLSESEVENDTLTESFYLAMLSCILVFLIISLFNKSFNLSEEIGLNSRL